jgi:hypothetical protein
LNQRERNPARQESSWTCDYQFGHQSISRSNKNTSKFRDSWWNETKCVDPKLLKKSTHKEIKSLLGLFKGFSQNSRIII